MYKYLYQAFNNMASLMSRDVAASRCHLYNVLRRRCANLTRTGYCIKVTFNPKFLQCRSWGRSRVGDTGPLFWGARTRPEGVNGLKGDVT